MSKKCMCQKQIAPVYKIYYKLNTKLSRILKSSIMGDEEWVWLAEVGDKGRRCGVEFAYEYEFICVIGGCSG